MNNVLGIIAGTLLPAKKLVAGGKRESVKTPYGRANLIIGEGVAFIQRHGSGDIPPHMINHRANLWALREYADSAVGVGSVGSLKRGIKPPMIVIPDDFLQFDPPTFYDDRVRHETPEFDKQLRKEIVDVAAWNKIRVRETGVYAQTKGPRLETRAEVRMLAQFADIVGMTIASEATLACELGLGYAAICSVDNMANGLAKGRLDFEDVRDNARKNSAQVELLLKLLSEGYR